jgi:hypothetical protein
LGSGQKSPAPAAPAPAEETRTFEAQARQEVAQRKDVA